MSTRTNVWAGLLAAAAGFWATTAGAQEYCVACSEPEAVYRCVIEGARPGSAQPLQMQCLSALTKAGGHGTCAIKRGTVFDCNGPVKRVPWTASAQETPAPLTTPPVEAKPAEDPSAPPKTVLEMTDRASKKAAEDMKKASESMKQGAKGIGEDLSAGAKKTWDCLSSLFFKC